MNYAALLAVGAGLLIANSNSHAADMPRKALFAPLPPWSWTGWYVGAHAGAVLGSSKVSDPHGASVFGDTVRTPGFLLGLQVGYNWQ